MEDYYRKFLIEAPLYAKFDLGKELVKVGQRDVDPYSELEDRVIQFDCYCVFCKQDSTFSRPRLPRPGGGTYYPNKVGNSNDIHVVQLRCARRGHLYHILIESYLAADGSGWVRKIGMSPSMEDIANSDLRKYRGIISKEDFSELHRAGGLAAHGIGVGSYVYLRRIFENQIQSHYQRHIENAGEIEGFTTLPMSEKISRLSDYLPALIVKRRNVYGILSKGVHELTEAECLEYFPVLRAAIIAILEQDYQIKQRAQAEQDLEKALNGIKV